MQLQDILEKSKDQAFADFFTLLEFPSISSEKEFQPDLIRCADWVQNYLKDLGFDVKRWPTSGHPVLFACRNDGGKDKPTLLLYNHYDVQPVDPLGKWLSPPFTPTIREGEVYARGAQDNKGQLFYVLWALKALIEREGKLPINIKLCIEGEEEIGSKGLAEILDEKKEDLKSDYLAVVDVGIPDKNTPAVTLGVRGIVTMDVEVTGSGTDLHSGSHGGIVFNPLHALVKMLDSLRNSDGKIQVDDFYKEVKTLTAKEKEKLSLNFNHEEYEKIVGAKPTGGEQEFSPLERAWIRPTLEINGLWGGYNGEGFKTVIPAKAFAKLSCRLVPDQDPKVIGERVKKHLEKNLPKGLSLKVTIHSGSGSSVQANPLSKVVEAFAKSYTEVFKKPCERIFEGGSIPIAAKLSKAAEADVVLVGLGLIGDQIHAPNEHFGLDRLQKGALIVARAIEILGNA